MDPRIEQLLPLVSSPARYMGSEKNAVQKSFDRVRLSVALAFPDAYEVGMSHLGLGILYHTLNEREDIAAERVFAPWFDMEGHMRAGGIPLASLESGRPLRAFDVVGFSLQYELSYTNVLCMLDLAGIPVHARDRDREEPLIIAGGPITTNPEPIADFFDIMVIGDGEESILEICDRVIEGKKGQSKTTLLEEISHIEGVYVPSFFQIVYHNDKTIKEIIPRREGYSQVRRRILQDLEKKPYPTAPLVPWLRAVHDRLSVEISRGCKRGCRFCHAGFVYRPYRERRPETVENLFKESLSATGYEEASFLSLSSGDYSSIETLLMRVMDHCKRKDVAVSFPSLRVETLKPEMIRQVKRVRKTGFTLAPEAATERLRRVINKEMDEEILLQAARGLYQMGWNLIKLYFMIGLPTETDEDVKEIIRLATRVIDQGRGCGRQPRLNMSVSTFVPKPHTPFQWETQLTLKQTGLRQRLLQEGLNRGGIRLKLHDPRMSLLEGVFSRGDRRLARVIHDAFKMGCRFDGWGESFRWELWSRAFEKNGIDMNFYIRGRAFSEILPWGHIRCGVREEFLKNEWQRSRQGVVTHPCRRGCTVCGLCDAEKTSVVSWEMKEKSSTSSRPSGPKREKTTQLLLEFQKVGLPRFLGHLDMAKAFHRAAKRAKIPLRYSQGFHPTPRISFERALALGLESLSEQMKWELENPVNERRLMEYLNNELPQGLRIIRVSHVFGKYRFDAGDQRKDHYLVACREEVFEDLETRIKEFLGGNRRVVFWDGKKRKFDMRPYIETIRLTDSAKFEESVIEVWPGLANMKVPLLEIVLFRKNGRGIRIDKALSSILSLSEEKKRQLRILRLDKMSDHGR